MTGWIWSTSMSRVSHTVILNSYIMYHKRDYHISILGCGLLCGTLNVITETRNFSEIQRRKYHPQSRAGQVRTNLRIFMLVSRTEAIESATLVRNTVGSVKWVLTFASINEKCVLIKMSGVDLLKGTHTGWNMRRCMHRVLGFMKPALKSVYLPLFTDPELHTSQHASWNPEIDARIAACFNVCEALNTMHGLLTFWTLVARSSLDPLEIFQYCTTI